MFMFIRAVNERGPHRPCGGQRMMGGGPFLLVSAFSFELWSFVELGCQCRLLLSLSPLPPTLLTHAEDSDACHGAGLCAGAGI